MTTEDDLAAAQFQFTLPQSPYPGLRPFNKEEWPIFFGRERMADEVVARLIRDQFVVVHGDSGCGKSSLIRAGVLPRLEQEGARGGLSWRTTITQPRNAPLQMLAESLASLDGQLSTVARTTEIRRVLNFGAAAPSALASILRHGPTDYICVLIDQFEELFSYARHAPDADANLFVEVLVALLESPPQGLYAVVTMRSEFLGACARYPRLAEAVNRAQYLLPRMEHPDLVRAIREPAELYGGSVTQELAERLISDTGRAQDQLPLIQHGLMQMSQTKRAVSVGTDAWRLELADYRRTGDLSESLSSHADAVLASVEQPPYPIAERMFRALTEINADGQAIRRPQTVAQLATVCGRSEDEIIRIADAFRAEGSSFLTPFGAAPLRPESIIDISHEALIRCWSRIAAPSGWLSREFQDGLLWRSLLAQADDCQRDPDHLLTLAAAEDQVQWMATHNAGWAERYGGGWREVDGLVRLSVKVGRAARQERIAAAKRRQWYTVSFAVFLVATAVGLALLNARANRALASANDSSAASLWNRLDFTNPDRLLDDELNALWEVRLVDDAVRQSFFEQLTKVPERIARLSRRPQPVLQALANQWTEERADALRDAVVREATDAHGAGLVPLAPAVQATASFMTPAQAQSLFDSYLNEIGTAKGSTTPAAISAALGALAQTLEPAQAAATLSVTLQALASPPVTEYVFVLGAGATALSGRIPQDQIVPSLAATLSTIAATTDPNVIVTLTPAAQALSRRLQEGEVGTELVRILSALRAARSAPESNALATIALDLTNRTTPPEAATGFKVAVETGLAMSNDAQVGAIVAGLAARAPADDALRLGRRVVNALGDRKPGQRVGTIAAVVEQLRPRLAPDEQRRINELLLRQLTTVDDAFDANALAAALAVTGPTVEPLAPEQVRRVVPALIAAAHYGDEYVAIGGFTRLATEASQALTAADARRELGTVITQMSTTTMAGKLHALTALVPPLATHLTPEDAAGFLPQTWALIRGTTDANQLDAFSALVPNLAPRLPPPAATRSLGVCVGHLSGATDPDQIGALSTAAKALADLVPADPRAAALQPAQRPIEESDPDRLARFAPVIPLMAPSLTSAQADRLLPRLIVAMESTLYSTQLAALEVAASAVAQVVSSEQRLPFATLAAKALSGTNDPDRVSALTGTIGALGAAGALGGGIEPPSRNLLQTLVAWSATPEKTRAALLRMIATPADAAAPSEASLRALAETLKYPTVTGDNVALVLTALKKADPAAPGVEGGVAANLAWAAKKYGAPVSEVSCPAPLLPSLSCPSAQVGTFF